MRSTEDRNHWRKINYQKSREYAVNNGSKWSDDDIETLLSWTRTDRELSQLIGRSVQSIQVKRGRYVRNAGTSR
jgi:hypothetical protein